MLDLELFQHINNYSLHCDLFKIEEDPPIELKKSIRLASSDSEWPEIHTLTVGGYIHRKEKYGFDGYDFIKKQNCEVKSSSKVIDYESLKAFSEGNVSRRIDLVKAPFDGRGVFSLLTQESFDKYSDGDVNMLVSGYVNGVLMFIIEFPFSHPTFSNHIAKILATAKSRSKSVSFTYKQYRDCKNAKLVYITPNGNNRQILKSTCTRNFYKYLESIS